MNKIAVIFTMKGCPHCVILKEMLEDENIGYVDRDIYEFEEEYNMFVEATGSDYVPAFMLVEDFESETAVVFLSGKCLWNSFQST